MAVLCTWLLHAHFERAIVTENDRNNYYSLSTDCKEPLPL